MLLDHRADATASNEEGWTPLHLASRAGAADKVALLLRAPGVNAGESMADSRAGREGRGQEVAEAKAMPER